MAGAPALSHPTLPNFDGVPTGHSAPGGQHRRGGFRARTMSRSRIASGLVLIAIAVAGNLIIYASSTSTTPVVQAVRDVPAGAQISAGDLRIVEIGGIDPSVSVIGPDEWVGLVGEYAVGRITAGSLIVRSSTQPHPIVNPGHSIVAIDVRTARIPHGIRERSRVDVVLPPEPAHLNAGRDDESPLTVVVPGIVVAPPQPVSAIGDTVALSLEVLADDAHLVVTHSDPSIVLLPPLSVESSSAGDAAPSDGSGRAAPVVIDVVASEDER
ncbi:MAG: hypothetical protein ISP33_03975 [Ilumatobacteraceae bacterium]|nr:hypothetical protein [Ilumatobacteraceae bacterium]